MRAKRDAEAQQSHMNWIADYAVSTLKHHHPQYLNVEHELHFGRILQPLKRLSILASFCQNRPETSYRCTMVLLQPECAASQSCAHRAPLFAGGSHSCRIESPDRKLAPRQRTLFVAIHDRKPLSHVGKDGCEFLRPLWPRPCVVQDAGRKRLQ